MPLSATKLRLTQPRLTTLRLTTLRLTTLRLTTLRPGTLLGNALRMSTLRRTALRSTCFAVVCCLAAAGQQAPLSAAAAEAYRAGTAAAARGDLDTASQQLEKAVGLSPGAEVAHSALGTVLLRQGHMQGGIAQLEAALALRPADTQALQNLAFAYSNAGQPAKAAAAFSRLTSQEHAAHRAVSAQVQEAYAGALVNSGHAAEAAAILRQRAAASPRNSEAQDQLGSVYAMQKQWAPAVASFRKAIALQPDFAIAHLHLGIALHGAGEPGAFAEIERAYKLAPGNAQIAAQYNAAKEQPSEQPLPLDELRARYAKDPSAENAYQLGLALQDAGSLDEALPLLERAANATPKVSRRLVNYGVALCRAQRAKDAVPYLLQAIAMPGASATAHQDLAVAYVQLSQFSDAAAELEKALLLSPDSPELHYNLGLVCKMQDDAARAIPELEKAQKLNPGAHEPGYVLGILYLQAGRYEDAERALSASLRLQPQNGDGWATLGSVDNNLNRLPEAEDALHKAIAQLPGQADPHLTLAAVLAKEGRSADATAERHQAAGLMHAHMDQQRAEVATNTGNNLLKAGKLEEARAAFGEALSYDSNDNAAHEGLAEILERQGKAADAAAERRKISPATQ